MDDHAHESQKRLHCRFVRHQHSCRHATTGRRRQTSRTKLVERMWALLILVLAVNSILMPLLTCGLLLQECASKSPSVFKCQMHFAESPFRSIESANIKNQNWQYFKHARFEHYMQSIQGMISKVSERLSSASSSVKNTVQIAFKKSTAFIAAKSQTIFTILKTTLEMIKAGTVKLLSHKALQVNELRG